MKNRGLIVIGIIVIALIVWMMMGGDATSPEGADAPAEVTETPEITEENAADIAAELEGLDIADIEAEFEAIDEDYENL